MKAVSTPTGDRSATSQMPKAHTTSRPISVSSVTVGENRRPGLVEPVVHLPGCGGWRRGSARPRAFPGEGLDHADAGMVSASTLVTSPHTRSIFSKPVRRRSRTSVDHPGDEGQRQQRHQRQPRVDREQDHRRHADHQHVGGEVQQRAATGTRVDAVGLAPMRDIRSPVRLPPK